MVKLYHPNATQPIQVSKSQVEQMQQQGWVTKKPTPTTRKKPTPTEGK